MPLSPLLLAPIALLPTLIFLIVLDQLDSFRLVSLRTAIWALASGGAITVMSYFVNGSLMTALDVDITTYTRYVAPVVEETLKASLMIYLFSRARIGFLIDAAILGFAIGAGFALIENIYFLLTFPQANIGIWIVRGFGTAMMHGGSTAIFGVLVQRWGERQSTFAVLAYIPGLLVAIALHSLFNHLTANPMMATTITMLLTPAILMLVFAKSEHGIHDWLLKDHDTHEQLLAGLIERGVQGPASQFVADLAEKFGSEHAKDIYDYMRVHAELVLRAEEQLLAHERHEKSAITEHDREQLARLHQLERKIGRTAMLALWPHLKFSRREMAELYEFESKANGSAHWV